MYVVSEDRFEPCHHSDFIPHLAVHPAIGVASYRPIPIYLIPHESRDRFYCWSAVPTGEFFSRTSKLCNEKVQWSSDHISNRSSPAMQRLEVEIFIWCQKWDLNPHLHSYLIPHWHPAWLSGLCHLYM